jgi:hypothetical protein
MASGGRSGSSYNRNDIDAIRREASERLEQRRVDAEVNSLLQQKLARVSDRDVETVNSRLDAISDVLGDDVGEIDRLTFGGSVAKHTYVDGLSDVDALLHIRGDSARLSPEELLGRIKEALETRLPQGEIATINVGRMAVTVRYRDGDEIQLVPAIERLQNRIAVADASGRSWSDSVDPRAFTRQLTETNQRQGGMVVPIIKLAKAIFDNRLGGNTPSGYHVEALAVAAFHNYDGPRTHKAMLSHFLTSAANGVLRPSADPTGQSTNVDAGLGAAGSEARRALSRQVENIARIAERATSLSQWRELLE